MRCRRGTRSPTDEKKLYARQMEVYAGYQENADWNVGRLLDAVEEMGELDDTLVHLHLRATTARAWRARITGSFNELTMQNGIALTAEQQLSLIEQYGGLDAWGTDASRRTTPPPGRGPATRPSSGEAGRLPPRRHAQRHGRGLAGTDHGRRRVAHPVRPLHRHRPDDPRGGRDPRAQGRRRDRRRSRWRATSFLYTLRGRGRRGASHQQYFETIGNRAIYKDGWWAALQARPDPLGRLARRRWRGSRPETTTRTTTPGSCTTCPTTSPRRTTSPQSNPEKLDELKELFWEEAEKHNVLPLLGGFSVFFGILPPMPTITTHTFYGDVENIASGMIPRVYGRSYAIEAELDDPRGGRRGRDRRRGRRDGRLLAVGRRDGLLHHSYSMMGVEHYQQVSTEPIPTGDVTVRMQFDADRQEPSTGGDGLALRQRREDRRRPDRETVAVASPATPAWTSAATTASSSTAPTPTRHPTPFTEQSRRSSSTSSRPQPRRREGAPRGWCTWSRRQTASGAEM